MAEAYPSLCLPITRKSIVLSDHNEVSTCVFAARSQDKLVLQDFQDPFGILLKALEKINVAWFVIISLGFSGYCELPTLHCSTYSKKVRTKFQCVAIYWIGYIGRLTTHDCTYFISRKVVVITM